MEEKRTIQCDNLSEEERLQINKEKKGTGLRAENIGSVTFKNNWGATISEVTIRHRRGNKPEKEESHTYYGLLQGESTAAMNFVYETGATSPFDYWWIKFVVLGNEYTIKDNFYCSVSWQDDGNVELTANGDNNKLHVHFSYSSDCDVSIKKPLCQSKEKKD
ncbi:MAG: hypothetical protein ACI39H_09000 [Lachnospiraceae bacterium]